MTLFWRVPLAIALWLSLIDWPAVPRVGLDPSWQQVLVDAWMERRRFGADLIFTYGPWGGLFVSSYLPGLIGTKIVFELVAKLVLAIVLVDVCGPLRLLARVIFIAALLLLGLVYHDPLWMFVILVLTVHWLLPADGSAIRAALALVVLGVIGLVKFTFLVQAGVGVVCAAIATAAAGRTRRAALMVVAWIAALLVGWLAAGQRLSDIPEYVRLSREVSIGYAGAMYIDETWPMFAAGVTLLAVHAAWLLSFLLRAGVRADTLATTACLAVGIAMAWKVGFIRADLHVFAFFAFSIWLVAAAPVMTRQAMPMALLLVATGLSAGALASALAQRAGALPLETVHRISRSAERLVSLGDARTAFERGAAMEAANHQLPAVRAAVGARSIDYLGDNQALLFFNGLDYRPRPVPQSYVTYTSALSKTNADFLQSERRPDYILASIGPIDRRYPAQDDAMLMAELPRRYEQVLTENGQLLLKARALQPAASSLALTTLVDRAVHQGEHVTLPSERTHALWLEVDARPSRRGWLRNLFYKPAGLALTTVSAGEGRATYRLVAGIARAGFIVQPPLLDGTDLQAFVNGEANRWLEGFAVEVAPGAQAYWERPLQVRVSRLETVPLRVKLKSPFAVLVENEISNVAPKAVTSTIEWRLIRDPEPLLLLHAPGAATFEPPDGQRHLTGRFGIIDGAYTNGNRTDGVEFTVSVVTSSRAEETVFGRTLQPLTRAADRGPQALTLDLPADPGLRVIIRTGYGAAGDGQWDWSYVTALRFTTRP